MKVGMLASRLPFYSFTILKTATHMYGSLGLGHCESVGDLDSNRGRTSLKLNGRTSVFYHHLKIELVNIDVKQRIARISIDYSPLNIPPVIYHKWPWEYESPAIPLTSLGPGTDTVIVNEKIIRTPEWSLRPILKSLAISPLQNDSKTRILGGQFAQESLKQ